MAPHSAAERSRVRGPVLHLRDVLASCPSVAVSWSDATYDATAHPASAQVNGVGGETGLAPAATFEYFSGSRQGALAVAARFLPAGIHHILIGPDHILFLIGLLMTLLSERLCRGQSEHRSP